MTTSNWLECGLYFAVLLILVKPLGWYMARVYAGQPCGLDWLFGPLERLLYRLSGVNSKSEMNWATYAFALLIFNALGTLRRIRPATCPRNVTAESSAVGRCRS